MTSKKHPVHVERAPTVPGYEWPEELAELLGKIPDHRLAEEAGIHPRTVAIERLHRKIEAFQPRRKDIQWTGEMIAMLGKSSDRKVAALLGLCKSSVSYKRRILGIEASRSRPHDKYLETSWSSEDLALLGKVIDREIAERLGVSSATVTRKRKILGIEACQPAAPRIEWSEDLVGQLGQETDTEVARRHGISASSVEKKRQRLEIAGSIDKRKVVLTPELVELLRLPSVEVRRQTGFKWETIRALRQRSGVRAVSAAERRWTPEVVARLGHETDADIARDVGLSTSRVSVIRRSLGIAATRSWRRWQLQEVEQLGTAPDSVIAERLGRTLATVQVKRRTSRIARFQEKVTSESPAATDHPPPGEV